jgi:hypothetical protein
LSGPVPESYTIDSQTGTVGMRAREMTLRIVPGDRDTMMQEPFVEDLAAELRRLLAAADPRGGRSAVFHEPSRCFK